MWTMHNVDNAQLDSVFGKSSLNRIRKNRQPIDTGNQDRVGDIGDQGW